MGLPLQINVTDVQALLRADVKSAWSLTDAQIWDDAEEVKIDTLPRANIALMDGRFDGEAGGAAGYGVFQRYQITGRFAKPGSGTLLAAKAAKVNALLNLLTAEPDYHGFDYDDRETRFEMGDAAVESENGYYSVTVTFVIEVTG